MARLLSIRRPSRKAKTPTKQSGRKKSNRNVYGTQRWKEQSERYRRANPFCVQCLDKDEFVDCSPGKNRGVVDHIVPINKGADPWDQSNWQTLCHSCHNRKSSSQDK